jgi:DNA-binding NarL/FixJ family response regulator
VRVVIAEDNVLLAEGLQLLLARAGIDVVAAVDDAAGFVAAVLEHRPDATIVDVRLPPGYRDEGIRAALEVREHRPRLPVLVLSQYVEHTYAGELVARGAAGIGYLLKDRVSRVSEFVDSLRHVAAGGTAIDHKVVEQLLTRRRNDPLDALTPREHQVLAMMAEGHDNATIGARLVITESSVNKHIGNVFAKLGLPATDAGNRRVQAVLKYLDRSV